MLQSWNKLCLTSGYIEFAVALPTRPDENTRGYVSVWSFSFASFRSCSSLLVLVEVGKGKALPSGYRNIGETLRWNVGSGYLFFPALPFLLPPKLTD
jgi:hypothetical protein